jgi:hypothetical protein
VNMCAAAFGVQNEKHDAIQSARLAQTLAGLPEGRGACRCARRQPLSPSAVHVTGREAVRRERGADNADPQPGSLLVRQWGRALPCP